MILPPIKFPPPHHPRSLQDRHQVAEQLRKIAAAVESNTGPCADTETVVILGVAEHGAWGWFTPRTEAEAREHAQVLTDMLMWQWTGGQEDRPGLTDYLQERWERRRRADATLAQRDAEAAAAKPWICEFCDRRFVTERGAEQHERNCWQNPGARRYGPDGHYDPSTNAAGKIIGFARRRDEDSDG